MIRLYQSKLQKAGIVSMLAFCTLGTAFGQQELSKVNSIYDEQHPVLDISGDLYFSKGLHPGNLGGERDLGDIWMSPKVGETSWAEPIHLKSLSTQGNDVVVGFPSSDRILVYHEGGSRKQGIHQYVKQGNSWTYDKALEMGSFRNNSTHFSGRLNDKGDIIIMTLESFGSYGNEDIYVSFKKSDGSWSSPQNLGPDINTYKQEMTPSLSKDGLTLYFSSNGHGTTGGRNILYAQRLDNSWEKWSTPVALSEVNSPGVELAYIELGDRAMFTTTQNSEGYGDILITNKVEIAQAAPVMEPTLVEEEKPRTPVATKMEIKRDSLVAEVKESSPEEIKILKPEAKETKPVESINEPITSRAEEKKAVETQPISELKGIVVLDINTLEEVVYSAAIVGESDQNRNQQLEDMSPLSGQMEVRISSKGYFPQLFSVEALQQLQNPIYLTPIVKGTSIILDDIYFKKGTSDLSEETSPVNISKIADFLRENPDIKIRLEGHTDNLGDPQLNKELSINRASQIRSFLVEKGIGFERIRVSGWGGSKPVANNQTEEGRNQNRRVEMVIEQ